MEQLRLEYFWPLTEQINLDLDYTRTHQYEIQKRTGVNYTTGTLVVANGNTDWKLSNTPSNVNTRMCVDVGELPVTLLLPKKPNWFMRYVYKNLGMKWVIK